MVREIYAKVKKRPLVLWSILLASIVIAEIVLTLLIPAWREFFYNSLQQKNQSQFMTGLMLFATLMLSLGASQGLKVWTGYKVSFLIREAATKVLFKKWLGTKKQDPAYNSALTESLRQATETYLEIAVEVIISATIVVSLIMINIHNTNILIAALIYTIVISIVATFFNKPLVSRNARLQMADGVFRSNLTKLSTGIDDWSHRSKWSEIKNSYFSYIKMEMFFVLFTKIKSSTSMLIPYLLLSPLYFGGDMTMGEFMSGVSIFELIVLNSTIIMLLYPKLAKARASLKIVKDFNKSMEKERNGGNHQGANI